MIDAIALGKLLAEDAINAEGPCLYPGKFRPPHIGHYKAATQLAARSYITEVIVIISSKVSEETDNITPETALRIWHHYLNSQPNSKIRVQVSEHASPIGDMIDIIKRNPEAETIYVAGGDDEKDDEHYLESLTKMFPGKVKSIKVHEKDGEITAPYIRGLVKRREVGPDGKDVIPDQFKDSMPVAAFNKGGIKIWNLLKATIPIDKGQGTDQALR